MIPGPLAAKMRAKERVPIFINVETKVGVDLNVHGNENINVSVVSM